MFIRTAINLKIFWGKKYIYQAWFEQKRIHSLSLRDWLGLLVSIYVRWNCLIVLWFSSHSNLFHNGDCYKKFLHISYLNILTFLHNTPCQVFSPNLRTHPSISLFFFSGLCCVFSYPFRVSIDFHFWVSSRMLKSGRTSFSAMLILTGS